MDTRRRGRFARNAAERKTARSEMPDGPFKDAATRLVHVNKEIADTADDENSGNGPQD